MFGQHFVHSMFSDCSVEGVFDKSVEGSLDNVDMNSCCGDKIKIANKHVRFLIRLGTEELAGTRGLAK